MIAQSKEPADEDEIVPQITTVSACPKTADDDIVPSALKGALVVGGVMVMGIYYEQNR